ncbi:MAG: hypothetical protein HW403_1376 [Dehalococcoidia bacterium]|nr:hypothetical protein [Dehalococcoidia bacterium]
MVSSQPSQSAPEEVVLYEKKEGYSIITLNRPDVLNVFNQELLRSLVGYLDQSEADAEVKAVILTAAGRAFSGGGDLTQRGQPQAEGPRASQQDVELRMWNMSKPVIAAVRGYAVGGACEMVMMADLLIAAEDAQFGEPQIRHGGGLPALIMPWILGIRRAKGLILTGELIDAHTAERYGLVNKVVPNDKLMEEAEALAQKIAALPPATVKSDKRLINRVFELMGLLESISYRNNPAYSEATQVTAQSQEDLELRKLLDEQGWEAFIRRRDAPFREPRP